MRIDRQFSFAGVGLVSVLGRPEVTEAIAIAKTQIKAKNQVAVRTAVRKAQLQLTAFKNSL